jgi:tryptophan-rich sensory protein
MAETDKRRRANLTGIAVIATATLGTAVSGNLSGDFGSAWYQHLRKPVWQPSGTVIGAVWTVLYSMSCVAASLLWWHRARMNSNKLWWFLAGQYALNFAFTPVLTRLHALRLATLDSAVLSLLVALLVRLAWPVHRVAALMLVPYVLWTAFATVLSERLWKLNQAR